MLAVHREESEGVKGLQKTLEKTQVRFPVLLDPGAKLTARYSTTGFTTYVVDKQGKIRAVLEGTKTNRPTADSIFKELVDIWGPCRSQ